MSIKVKYQFVLFCLSFLVINATWKMSTAQSIVVSEYMNYNSAIGLNAQYDEWTELLVVGDNVDLRNYSIRDNNNDQTAWQPEVNFNNIPFWQHMRAGTIIILRHRCTDVNGIPYVLDSDPSDGYLELCLENTFYFNGGSFGGSLDNTMNIASDGDIIQLRDASGNHVHALSHKSTPGSSWTTMSCPKINHASGLLDGETVKVTPGNTLNDYGIGGSCISGVAYSSAGTVSSLGLANSAANKNFWRFVREPSFTTASIFPSSVVAGMPGSITFSWPPAVDPYPSDGVVKYLIVRNTFNFFSNTNPLDGTEYAIGQPMGFGSAVFGIINSSTINTFTDNTVLNGQTYYYKVYAYRYNQDNINGNSYSNERGSAYGTPSVLVNWPFTTPLPIELVTFYATPKEREVVLNWATASETNNDFFTIERSQNGVIFEPIGFLKGSGNSNQMVAYHYVDKNPLTGISYYRLKQTDYDGKFTFSETAQVDSKKTDKDIFQSVYPNPVKDNLYLFLNAINNEEVSIQLMDVRGSVVKNIFLINSTERTLHIQTEDLSNGIYFLKAESNSLIQIEKIFKVD